MDDVYSRSYGIAIDCTNFTMITTHYDTNFTVEHTKKISPIFLLIYRLFKLSSVYS